MKKEKFKLASGKEVQLLEMSVDDIDFCNDVPIVMANDDGSSSIRNMSAARTAWIRRGVKGANDKFIKGLSEDDKNELDNAEYKALKIKFEEYNYKVYDRYVIERYEVDDNKYLIPYITKSSNNILDFEKKFDNVSMSSWYSIIKKLTT